MDSADEIKDSLLVERAKAGEKEAFSLLVQKYQFKIMKLISRYIRDHSEVMDVSQETFIKAYRALDNFRGDSSFYTWIYRIAINSAKNHLISQSRRALNPQALAADVDLEQAVVSVKLSENSTPENMLIREEIEKVVLNVIDALPTDLQTAITLRELDGLSYEDIAFVMDCPVGTVRSRIFRAREAIEAKIKPLLKNS